MTSRKRKGDSLFNPRETDRRMTFAEILQTPHEIRRRPENAPPPEPHITWSPVDGPPGTSPLCLLQRRERNHVTLMPAFMDARTYFEELEGMVDLPAVQDYGWKLADEERAYDEDHTWYRMWKETWHLLVATHDDGSLAFWLICRSVPEA